MAVKTYHGGDQLFLAACELAKLRPSRRQWVKYSKQGRGLALRHKAAAAAALAKSGR